MRLTAILDDQHIADILLVWSGFKPAALIELSYFPRIGFSREKFHKKITDLEKIFENSGLCYELRLNYPKSKNEHTRYSSVAKDKKTLVKLKKASTIKNTRSRRIKLGTLLGYPRTAVFSFANGTALDYRDLWQEMRKSKELKFLNFRLSKRHWHRELKYLKKRASAIKQISPELYKKITHKSKEGQF